MNPLRWPLSLQTVIAMLLGILVGVYGGPGTSSLGFFSKAMIQLIMTFATPLLFLAILEAVISAQIKGKGVFAMLAISAINACFAITIALLLSNIFQPGRLLDLKGQFGVAAVKSDIGWGKALTGLFPESLVAPFMTNSIPGIILIAVFGGAAFHWLEKRATTADQRYFDSLKGVTRILLNVNLRIMEWIVRLTPLAVFGAVAKVVGEHGFAMARGLGAYLLLCSAGMALQVIFVYQTWIRAIAKKSLLKFWGAAKEPAVYSFGVNSSLATLPVTLKALDRLNVSPASARLSACVGTNFNNDGILLYEVAAALFIAQAHGIELGVFQQLGVAVICIIATVGVAGIPEAGIISLSLVLTAVGLPPETIPILLTVDWILARLRSVTNVLSDMTVAIAIDEFSSSRRV